jgi:pimeloyl-ACP methyl ester carboxylesterase
MPDWKYDNSILHYEVIGEGYPIVFLHGWGHSGNTFMEIASNLKNKFKCYLIDLPGFGLSDIQDLTWGSKHYANEIKNFINKLNFEEVILVGHSFGGKIATLTANMIVEKVKKLILIDTAGIKAPMTFSKFIKIYLFKFGKTIKNSGILFGLGDIIFKKIERFSGSSDYLNAGKIRNVFKTIVREDISVDFKQIKCPTLILWGEKDTATPLRDAYKIKELIAESRLIVFPDLGHQLPIESPHQIAHHIKEFVE